MLTSSKNVNRVNFIFYCISLIIGVTYGTSWIGLYNPNLEQDVTYITQFTQQKPFVFRILVPFMTRILSEALSIPPDYAILIMVTIIFIGVYWALQNLGRVFSEDQMWLMFLSLAGVLTTFSILMLKARRIYDPATVLFFALALSLLARGRFWQYYIIFPIATLNRETTFLLIGFFAIYFFNKMPLRNYLSGLTYQTAIYMVIRYSLETIFSDNGGKSFFLFDYHVIQTYIANPTTSILILLTICIIIIAALWKPSDKPAILKVAFLCIFPAQILLHFILGYPYEFRVFLESIPVIIALFISSHPKTVTLVTNKLQ